MGKAPAKKLGTATAGLVQELKDEKQETPPNLADKAGHHTRLVEELAQQKELIKQATKEWEDVKEVTSVTHLPTSDAEPALAHDDAAIDHDAVIAVEAEEEG